MRRVETLFKKYSKDNVVALSSIVAWNSLTSIVPMKKCAWRRRSRPGSITARYAAECLKTISWLAWRLVGGFDHGQREDR